MEAHVGLIVDGAFEITEILGLLLVTCNDDGCEDESLLGGGVGADGCELCPLIGSLLDPTLLGRAVVGAWLLDDSTGPLLGGFEPASNIGSRDSAFEGVQLGPTTGRIDGTSDVDA